MVVLSPLGSVSRRVRTAARRRPVLAGRSLGLLDNSKPNATVLLGEVAALLAARAGIACTRVWRKPSSAQAAPFLEAIAREVDLVLTGSAD